MIVLFPMIMCTRIGQKEPSLAMTNDPGGVRLYDHDSRNERLEIEDSRSKQDDTSSVAPSQFLKGLGVKGNRDYFGRDIPDSLKYKYTFTDWRPTNDRETMLATYHRDKKNNRKYKIFVDNPP